MRYVSAFAFIAVLALFLSGCTQNSPPPVSVEPQTPGNLTSPQIPPAITPSLPCSTGNMLQKDACFLALAKDRKSPELCRSIYSIETLDECYGDFADNLEICKKISNPDSRTACLTKIAEKEKSDGICAMIENADSRLACLRKVLPPCMLIEDENSRLECLALEKNDYTLCKTDSCFLNFAVNKSKSDPCLLITPPANRQACLAVVGKSVAICTEATLVPVQDYCVELASAMLDRQSGCAYASPKSDYRNRCYTHFAVAYANMTICRLADPEGARDTCYRNYSISLADTSACKNVVETLNNQNCYYASAVKNRMPSLCNPLPVQSMRDNCYSQPIFSKQGPVASDCESVSSQVWRDKCLFEAAKMSDDGSLCAKISPGPDYNACLNLFGTAG